MINNDLKNYNLYLYLLRIADTSLIMSQRLSEYCGVAPILEEDLSISNISLDYLGQARFLYTFISEEVPNECTEDDFAFFRDDDEFYNLTISELPNFDFARTIVKIFFLSALQIILWNNLKKSNNVSLSGIAKKSVKEAEYHFEHSSGWINMLGNSTEKARLKTQDAMDYLSPYTNEFFVDDENEKILNKKSVAPLWSNFSKEWHNKINVVLGDTSLNFNLNTQFQSKGKFGLHSEFMSKILSEMQSTARKFPGCKW